MASSPQNHRVRGNLRFHKLPLLLVTSPDTGKTMKIFCGILAVACAAISLRATAAEPDHTPDLTTPAGAIDPVCEIERQRRHRFPATRMERQLKGWRVLISQRLLDDHAAATEQALELLAAQLEEIVRVVPADAVAKLRKVPLYLSPAYDGFGAKAEYHPAAGWLREHGRDPAMEKAVEFTNILIFAEETRRMPNFTLHELAHAYHDRELAEGFSNPDVIAAFERARAGGIYDRVERQDTKGTRTTDRAYALTNQQEYFAETTEAYFSRNDFFPFCREELESHDPHACRMLQQAWGCGEQ